MDKLKLWLIPAIIVILIIAGLVYFRGRVPQEEVGIGPGVTEEPGEVPTGPKGFAQPREPSPEQKAANDATAMSGALHSGDIADCEKITWDEALKQQCLDNLNYVSILKSGDEEGCARLADAELRQKCFDRIYLGLAVDNQDLATCDRIVDERMQAQCQDSVHSAISFVSNDVEDCEGIVSTSTKTACEDKAILATSIQNNDSSSCSSIEDLDLRSQCEGTIATNLQVIAANQSASASAKEVKTAQEMLTLCESLAPEREAECKDRVYPRLALEEKDLSYCDLISDDQLAAQCKVEQGQNIDQYYLRMARIEEDSSICQKILNMTIRNTCLDAL